MKNIHKILYWFNNLFSKKGRTENYFKSALKNVRKAAIQKIKSKKLAKKDVIAYVKKIQLGPKKSNYELEQLLKRKGLKRDGDGTIITESLAGQLSNSGVKVNWKQMTFLN